MEEYGVSVTCSCPVSPQGSAPAEEAAAREPLQAAGLSPGLWGWPQLDRAARE